MNQIHPLAVVDPDAKLGDGNIIGPFCVIDKNVVIGDNNKFLNSVTLHFGTRLGNLNIYKASGFEIPRRRYNLPDR